ncbi:MAG: redoxin family protein [Bdellovibrionales bacterium]|nr:redoxin family protein [Oligoflexia bacterium]
MEISLIGYFASALIFISSAQAYTVKDLLKGTPVQVPAAGKKTTVLVFLSAKCPCSASHEETLKKLHAEYNQSGFEFIGVHSNQDESEALTSAHFQSANFPFPIIEDAGAKLADEYKAVKTPHVFLIQDEKIVFQGGVDDSAESANAHKNYLADALRELKSGQPVTVAKVRTLGCAIKR